MTEKERELVHRFKSLVEQRLHVCQTIVFGSRARGDAGCESDLDVLVVIAEPETNENLSFVSECAFEADLGNDFIISPMVISLDEWENGLERYSLLSLAIRKEGVPV